MGTEIEEKFTKWVADLTHITEEEKSDVFSKIETVRKWLSDNVDAQAEKAGHEEPVFTSEEVPLQTKSIQKLIAKLSKKPKPKPPKIEKKETENNSTENDTSDTVNNETTSAGTSETDEQESSGSDEATGAEENSSTEQQKTENEL